MLILRNQKYYFFIIILLISINWNIVNGCNNESNDENVDKSQAKSIILLIGDGMGMEQIEFGRLVEYGPKGNSSIFEFPFQANITTNNIYDEVTDSAASATAIATGYKTDNRIFSQKPDGQDLITILEIAEEKGYNTGVIATSALTSATPAAFMVHSSILSYYAFGEAISEANVEILFGGGSGYSHLGNFINKMIAKGYSYVDTRSGMDDLNKLPVIGLFADVDLIQERDRLESSSCPSLLEMTSIAIELLSSEENPFFMMIEGSQIDWACHEMDSEYLIHEIIAFEKTVAYVKKIAENDPNLLVLVTADHETGGFSILNYNFQTELPIESDDLEIKKLKRTNRAREMSVEFTMRYGEHTSKEVILTGMGSNSEMILSANHHINTFIIMNSTITPYTSGDCIILGYNEISLIVFITITSGIILIQIIKKRKRPNLEI